MLNRRAMTIYIMYIYDLWLIFTKNNECFRRTNILLQSEKQLYKCTWYLLDPKDLCLEKLF